MTHSARLYVQRATEINRRSTPTLQVGKRHEKNIDISENPILPGSADCTENAPIFNTTRASVSADGGRRARRRSASLVRTAVARNTISVVYCGCGRKTSLCGVARKLLEGTGKEARAVSAEAAGNDRGVSGRRVRGNLLGLVVAALCYVPLVELKSSEDGENEEQVIRGRTADQSFNA